MSATFDFSDGFELMTDFPGKYRPETVSLKEMNRIDGNVESLSDEFNSDNELTNTHTNDIMSEFIMVNNPRNCKRIYYDHKFQLYMHNIGLLFPGKFELSSINQYYWKKVLITHKIPEQLIEDELKKINSILFWYMLLPELLWIIPIICIPLGMIVYVVEISNDDKKYAFDGLFLFVGGGIGGILLATQLWNHFWYLALNKMSIQIHKLNKSNDWLKKYFVFFDMQCDIPVLAGRSYGRAYYKLVISFNHDYLVDNRQTITKDMIFDNNMRRNSSNNNNNNGIKYLYVQASLSEMKQEFMEPEHRNSVTQYSQSKSVVYKPLYNSKTISIHPPKNMSFTQRTITPRNMKHTQHYKREDQIRRKKYIKKKSKLKTSKSDNRINNKSENSNDIEIDDIKHSVNTFDDVNISTNNINDNINIDDIDSETEQITPSPKHNKNLKIEQDINDLIGTRDSIGTFLNSNNNNNINDSLSTPKNLNNNNNNITNDIDIESDLSGTTLNDKKRQEMINTLSARNSHNNTGTIPIPLGHTHSALSESGYLSVSVLKKQNTYKEWKKRHG